MIVQQQQSPRRLEARRLKGSGMSYKEVAAVMGISTTRAVHLVRPTAKERLAILMASGGKCTGCGIASSDLQLHHAEYGENAKIEVLCRPCHINADTAAGTRATSGNSRRGKSRRIHSTLHANNKSGYRGIAFSKRVGKWFAQISHNGERYYSKYFLDPADAAMAYDQMALEYKGVLASLNFNHK